MDYKIDVLSEADGDRVFTGCRKTRNHPGNGLRASSAIIEIVAYFSRVLCRLELKSDFFNSL